MNGENKLRLFYWIKKEDINYVTSTNILPKSEEKKNEVMKKITDTAMPLSKLEYLHSI